MTTDAPSDHKKAAVMNPLLLPRAPCLSLRSAVAMLFASSVLLAACGGDNDSAPSVDADSAGSVAADAMRAQALASTPAAAPPANATWTSCATEGGVCTVPATAVVRYGANGAYTYKTVTDSIGCNNAQWGDPIFGIVKACAYTGAGATGTPAPSAGWVACADEGGVCNVPGPSNVRYGANGTYFYKVVSSSVACGNGAWGDPIFGVVKACAYESSAATPAPTPPPASGTGWVTCAPEGGVCAFSGTRNARFGANGVHFYKTVTGSIACNNAAWGGDPIIGIAKSCAYDNGGTVAAPPAPAPTAGTATLAWSALADARTQGYRVYWGTAPGNYQQARGNGLAAGTATGYVVRDLPMGRTYYFAVTAYDASGTESAFSTEASKTLP